MISTGNLSLSVIGMVARAEIKSELVTTVLDAVKRKSKTQAEMILLKYSAVPAIRKKNEKVKAVIVEAPKPEETPQNSAAASSSEDSISNVFQSRDHSPVAKENHQAASPSAVAFQVSLCLSETSMQKLKRAQELLGTMDLASTIEELRGWTMYLCGCRIR